MRFLKTSPATKTRVWYLLISVIVLMSASQGIFADGFVRRSNHGALLEPIGKVIHGAGPTPTDFRNYWNVMGEGNKPMVYMDYVYGGLRNVTRDWADRLKAELLTYPDDRFVIPQIGLAMTNDGSPETHYEDEVAAGLLDDEIDTFLDGLEDLALPVYLRIGYEFNGSGWNGYEPDTYIQAFRRITDKIRERGLEVATVWDAAAAGDHNYYEYYPGNDYVDWWGINTFEPNHFQSISFPTHEFLDLAEAHNRPVMLGESTARGTGVLDGEISWNEWFVPYFQFIRSYPGIKMFCYINYDWTAHSQWEDWGDCRVDQNDYVSEHFDEEMGIGLYQHSASESNFRKTLGYDDDTAPPEISRVASDRSSYPAVLQWDPLTDISGLAHYIIHQNDDIVDYTLQSRYESSSAGAGDVVDYRVSAMDRAGNESPMSEAVRVVVPNSISKAVNGEFDDGFYGWNREVWGGSADFSIDASSAISGPNAAHINITSSPEADWGIQLRRLIKVHEGRNYTISYKAKANKEVNLITYLSRADNSDSYLWRSASLNTDVRSCRPANGHTSQQPSTGR